MKKAPASFQKQTLFLRIHFLLHQSEQQFVHILRGLAAGQKLVPKGQHRRRQQPAFIGTELQNSASFLSPEHVHTSAVN